jgi:hypothetical protein
MQQFDYSLGSLTTGQWRVALPADCDDQNSNRSIYNFRLGKGRNITWVDKEKWNDLLQDVAHTTLASNINIGDTTITLTNADDLQPVTAGVVLIGPNYYSYTAITGNVLTIPAATTTSTAGQDVFQNASTGYPNYWTTFGGYIYFYPVMDATNSGLNGYLDYYSKLIQTTTDTQQIVFPDPTVVQYYLSWKFLLRLNNGMGTEESELMKENYIERRAKMIQKETANRTFQFKPLLNKFDMRSSDAREQRLGNFPGYNNG